MSTDTNNKEFQLAVQFVTQTIRPIFLTGRAGTGKTTFLKYIRENGVRQMAVVAPTGVAAINAGGTTLHSFFQLPFGPFVPGMESALIQNIRLSPSKKEVLLELELLIIDEISMVRADTLDAIDTVLRHFRQQPHLPFGGVQILYIGDLYQLPPVASPHEWDLLKTCYASPFFFDSLVIRQHPPIYLELKKIYRQKEGGFINLLNNIRNNQVSWEDLERLHDHYDPEFIAPKNENYITLTSHNAKADSINQEELGKLRGRTHLFEASVTGEFNDKAYPAERTLTLKEGAQVMLIKNDKGEARRYYNGKIGVIAKITDEKLILTFPDDPDELTLEKETWKNVRYVFSRERNQIEEEELGTFRQYPIRLAWAITIHKSQGLTFEKAVIDAGASFAPGQVYVALSRLTGLEGLILRSRISPAAISTDPRVVAWTQGQQNANLAESQLEHGQRDFIGETLRKAFQWSRLVDQLREHLDDYAKRNIPDKESAIAQSRMWLQSTITMQDTALKFSRQLDQLLAVAEADGYRQLQQRTEAAVAYFTNLLETGLLIPLQEHIGELRGKKLKTKKYLREVQTLRGFCVRRKQQLEAAVTLVRGLQTGVEAGVLLANHHEDQPKEAPQAETPKAQKGDSHRTSLSLYREGISIADIATRRGLTPSTIEGHLASFIFTGEVDISELVPEHKIDPIAAAIREIGGSALGPIKSRLGNDYTFGEIRAVMNHLKHIAAQAQP